MFEASLIINKNATKSRIVLRLSHALFDATSLPVIFDTFASSFNRAQLSTPLVPFREYVEDVLKHQNESSAIQYWRQVLQNATMPRIGAVLPTGQLFRMRRTNTYEVNISKAPTQGIALASVVKAAWALTLMRHSQTHDILFAEAVAGRSAVRSTIAGAVGCCIALEPARIDVRAAWRPLDLLQFVQDQQIAGVAYETLGEHNVLDVCTELPSGTEFSSAINYQGPKSAVSLRLNNIDFLGINRKPAPPYGVTDVELYVT